ncbi:Uncharacterised protein [Yersinia enterocolitica]|uniref:PIN-like domain-containing protein n=1 Tax=Yersinia enterocolitica TaxID=630 RepID=UPI000659EB82|nr:PIN-like domain-containing protein [Yersinia enterocolitica]CRX53807.1 Uncharacterised protein [Yersinia enterocolitica]
MKDGFKGFYNPNGAVLEAIWNSQNTIFVFDTNVYLNIYSYAEKTKLDLFSVLEKIKKNLWVPNHVALEYQKRRLDVIDRERGNFTKITNVFNKFNNQINVEIIQNLGIEKKLPDLHKSLDDFLLKFNSLCDDFVKGVFEEQKKLKPDVRSSDEIRKKLDSILSGKVGQSFTQSELDEIYEEGEVRFANKIPPGFKDAGKDGDSSDFTYMSLNYKRKFGDFIIWKQLIKEASKVEIKNVVFITDDKKNDWWYGVGDKIIGPQEKLQSEFYSLTGVDTFKMYDTVDFLKDAVVYLGTKVDEKSFDDVKKTSSSVIINSASTDTSDLIGGHTVTSNNNASDEIDNSKESEMEDGVPLKEYLDIHETIRLSLGFESLREQEEAIRRSLGYDSIREQEEAIRRSLGVESLRKREEAIRRSLGVESLRKREEAIRRSLGVESLRKREEAIKRSLSDLERSLGYKDEMKTASSDEADIHLKESHKHSSKKNNADDNDQNSEDDTN